MNLNLHISSTLEEALKRQAAATGQDIESLVLKTLEESFASDDVKPIRSQRTSEEFATWLDSWINRHPIVNHRVDDSRESISVGRDE
jgi:hypothetical protein